MADTDEDVWGCDGGEAMLRKTPESRRWVGNKIKTIPAASWTTSPLFSDSRSWAVWSDKMLPPSFTGASKLSSRSSSSSKWSAANYLLKLQWWLSFGKGLLFICWFFNLFFSGAGAVCRLSLVAGSSGCSLTVVWGPHCSGFSCGRGWALGHMGFSSCSFRALEHRLSSCGAPAELLWSTWDLPRSGIEPVSPPLAGRFPSTVPLGKPTDGYFLEGRV